MRARHRARACACRACCHLSRSCVAGAARQARTVPVANLHRKILGPELADFALQPLKKRMGSARSALRRGTCRSPAGRLLRACAALVCVVTNVCFWSAARRAAARCRCRPSRTPATRWRTPTASSRSRTASGARAAWPSAPPRVRALQGPRLARRVAPAARASRDARLRAQLSVALRDQKAAMSAASPAPRSAQTTIMRATVCIVGACMGRMCQLAPAGRAPVSACEQCSELCRARLRPRLRARVAALARSAA